MTNPRTLRTTYYDSDGKPVRVNASKHRPNAAANIVRYMQEGKYAAKSAQIFDQTTGRLFAFVDIAADRKSMTVHYSRKLR